MLPMIPCVGTFESWNCFIKADCVMESFLAFNFKSSSVVEWRRIFYSGKKWLGIFEEKDVIGTLIIHSFFHSTHTHKWICETDVKKAIKQMLYEQQFSFEEDEI